MKQIAYGAEAKVFETKLFGSNIIIKQRISKKYRDPLLDKKIIKNRNKEEALLLKKLKTYNINTPYIYYVGKNKIVMEKLENTKQHKNMLNEIGKQIANLHNNNIIHGDLNLINILTNKKKIYFIDFGLGTTTHKLEDKATDLLVFKKTLFSKKSTEGFWKKIIKSYEKNINNKEILKKIQIIEKRARYL
jgi:Kae1-associated kinase Bud32